MLKRLLTIAIVAFLTACVSGTKPPDTYTTKNGQTTIIESGREMCERSCNQDYSRCMDMRGSDSDRFGGTPFGVREQCRSQLKNCLPGCKGQ